jgi:hypothetical protein
MAAWLDDHRELAGLVAGELRQEEVKATGWQARPVPAGDKLESLFEPHAAIIRKGRAVAYGLARCTWRGLVFRKIKVKIWLKIPRGAAIISCQARCRSILM